MQDLDPLPVEHQQQHQRGGPGGPVGPAAGAPAVRGEGGAGLGGGGPHAEEREHPARGGHWGAGGDGGSHGGRSAAWGCGQGVQGPDQRGAGRLSGHLPGDLRVPRLQRYRGRGVRQGRQFYRHCNGYRRRGGGVPPTVGLRVFHRAEEDADGPAEGGGGAAGAGAGAGAPGRGRRPGRPGLWGAPCVSPTDAAPGELRRPGAAAGGGHCLCNRSDLCILRCCFQCRGRGPGVPGARHHQPGEPDHL
mmetsp:Transcript_96143/g.220396  ORF Transcript_96143/g.220396 Transcript_96143/m.220396 type:complete len:247 (+) Transcript_96143:1227-1967(+)